MTLFQGGLFLNISESRAVLLIMPRQARLDAPERCTTLSEEARQRQRPSSQTGGASHGPCLNRTAQKRYGHLFRNSYKSIVVGRGCLHCRIAVRKLGNAGASLARYPGVTNSLVNRMANEKEITGLDESLTSSL